MFSLFFTMIPSIFAGLQQLSELFSLVQCYSVAFLLAIDRIRHFLFYFILFLSVFGEFSPSDSLGFCTNQYNLVQIASQFCLLCFRFCSLLLAFALPLFYLAFRILFSCVYTIIYRLLQWQNSNFGGFFLTRLLFFVQISFIRQIPACRLCLPVQPAGFAYRFSLPAFVLLFYLLEREKICTFGFVLFY